MKVFLCTDTVWLLSEEAFSIYASCMFQPTYEEYKARMQAYVSDPYVQIFAGETDRIRVGILVLDRSRPVAEIIGIAVSENQRHRGVGKNLIQNAMKTEHLDLICAQTDEEAIGFYRNCGFSEEKTVIEYPDGIAVRYNCILEK